MPVHLSPLGYPLVIKRKHFKNLTFGKDVLKIIQLSTLLSSSQSINLSQLPNFVLSNALLLRISLHNNFSNVHPILCLTELPMHVFVHAARLSISLYF
jgi:hypothetical protein